MQHRIILPELLNSQTFNMKIILAIALLILIGKWKYIYYLWCYVLFSTFNIFNVQKWLWKSEFCNFTGLITSTKNVKENQCTLISLINLKAHLLILEKNPPSTQKFTHLVYWFLKLWGFLGSWRLLLIVCKWNVNTTYGATMYFKRKSKVFP